MKSFYRFVFIGLVSIGMVYAGQGVNQKHLLSISPSSTEVTSKSNFVFTFDKPILKTSVKKHTAVLKQKKPQKQKIPTQISVLDNKLTMSPTSPLEKGIYVLKVKPLKLTQEGDNELQVKTPWQKFVAWLCGFFYKDISKCPLCQHFCYTSNVTYTKPMHFQFEVKDEAPKVISLESNATLIEISEYNSTQISIRATYEDNSTEDVTQKATYSSDDSSVDVTKGTVTTNAEGSASVTVNYGGKTAKVQVEVYEMIDGHLLPHEPQNPDATLLGVDENNNSVRDDVERWIYKTEFTAHPEINRVVVMQEARFYQMALVDPLNKDDKVDNALVRFIDCYEYYTDSRNIPLGKGGKPLSFDLIFKDKYFNTRERLKTYMDYNNGTGEIKVYTATPIRLLNVSYCDENIDVLP